MRTQSFLFASAFLFAVGLSRANAPDPASPAPSPDEALQQLVAGNLRYATSAQRRTHQDQERRCDTFAHGQHPVATILACSDSRAPVELLFDQGIGDVFVIRVAGNVAGESETGTVEYGVGHLGTPLIVVLGHAKCGAVTAAVENAALHGSTAKLVARIAPAAQAARELNPGVSGAPLVLAAIRANVFHTMEELLTSSEEVRGLVGEGKVKVVGAIYDLHGGTVEWIGPHPDQEKLLKGGVTAPKAAAPAKAAAAPADHGAPAVPAPAGHGAPAAPAPAGHGAPEAPAPHAAPAGHGGHGAAPASGELMHEATASAGEAEAPAPATQPAEKPAKPHNFAMLAIMGGASLGLSLLIIQFVSVRKTRANLGV